MIDNKLIDALTKVNLTPYETRVLLTIIRHSCGHNKQEVTLTCQQIEAYCGIRKHHIVRTIKSLLKKQIITKTENRYRIQDISKWEASIFSPAFKNETDNTNIAYEIDTKEVDKTINETNETKKTTETEEVKKVKTNEVENVVENVVTTSISKTTFSFVDDNEVPDAIKTLCNWMVKDASTQTVIAERAWEIAKQKGYFHRSMIEEAAKELNIETEIVDVPYKGHTTSITAKDKEKLLSFQTQTDKLPNEVTQIDTKLPNEVTKLPNEVTKLPNEVTQIDTKLPNEVTKILSSPSSLSPTPPLSLSPSLYSSSSNNSNLNTSYYTLSPLSTLSPTSLSSFPSLSLTTTNEITEEEKQQRRRNRLLTEINKYFIYLDDDDIEDVSTEKLEYFLYLLEKGRINADKIANPVGYMLSSRFIVKHPFPMLKDRIEEKRRQQRKQLEERIKREEEFKRYRERYGEEMKQKIREFIEELERKYPSPNNLEALKTKARNILEEQKAKGYPVL